jgi:hypothetical protein
MVTTYEVAIVKGFMTSTPALFKETTLKLNRQFFGALKVEKRVKR